MHTTYYIEELNDVSKGGAFFLRDNYMMSFNPTDMMHPIGIDGIPHPLHIIHPGCRRHPRYFEHPNAYLFSVAFGADLTEPRLPPWALDCFSREATTVIFFCIIEIKKIKKIKKICYVN